MPNRNAVLRAARRAALVAMLATPLLALPAAAASSVQIEARPFVAGRYEIGGWLGISVTLVNDGAPTEGYLSSESTSTLARRFVELPAGARKVVTLYVEPEAFQQSLRVTYTESSGSVSVEVPVSVFEQTADQYGIVGDATGTLRPQILGTDSGIVPHGRNLRELGLMVEGGMSPAAALEATTRSAAQLLRVDGDLGTIEPGKVADLVIVSGDPYDFATLDERVEQVWQSGSRVV